MQYSIIIKIKISLRSSTIKTNPDPFYIPSLFLLYNELYKEEKHSYIHNFDPNISKKKYVRWLQTLDWFKSACPN